MAIYRGTGGAGDADTGVTLNEIATYTIRSETAATNAETSETNAAASEAAAAISESNAATSESNAATSENNAAASYDAFDDRYLGSKSSDPALDNDGNALLTGALYWNSTNNEMNVWSGSSWVPSGLTTGTQTISGTKTFSSNPVLSAGTANGVLYLNGSKVATSGSALTFDGTNLGIGTSSPNNKLHINGAAADTAFQITNSATGSTATDGFSITVENPTPDVVIRNRESANMRFLTSNTERMRITSSGNLLVGTTLTGVAAGGSGTSGININANGGIELARSVNPVLFVNRTTSDGDIAQFRKDGVTVGSIGSEGGDALYIQSGTTSGTGLLFTSTGSTIRPARNGITVDATLDLGSNTRRFKDIYLSGKITNNGTGGINIDTSGNVGIGTSSPGSKLDVTLSSATAYSSGVTGNGLRLYNSSPTTGQYVGITFSGEPTSGNGGLATIMGTTTGSGNMDLVFSTRGSSVLAERLRLDSTGNLGIGTSSPVRQLHINNSTASQPATFTMTTVNTGTTNNDGFTLSVDGTSSAANIIQRENAPMLFYTNNVERARIDSSGNLLVGTTNSSASAGDGVKVRYNSGASDVSVVTTGSTDGSSGINLYSTGAGAFRFYVGNAGTVFATNTTITAISDQRLKENIQDIDVGLNAVMALKPRKFDWKEGKGKDIKGDRGWIAQEFEQVFPDMIDTWKDPAPEGEEPYKSVRADLIPVLVKAIQEQQVIIESLKARLDAANL